MKVTLKDIAKKVNVSVSTVSRVLNNTPTGIDEETRNKIFTTAKQLEYKKHRKSQKNNGKISNVKIGCLLYELKDKYKDPFFSEIIYGIEQELNNQGLRLKFTMDTLDFFDNPPIEKDEEVAIIIVGPISKKHLAEIREYATILISVGGLPTQPIDYVTINFEQSAIEAVNHLLGNGHRDIAFIGSSDYKNDSNIDEEARFLGYKKALLDSNIPLRKEWIKDGNFTVNGGYNAMKEILNGEHLPTALFVASDRMSYGAYKAIQEHNLSIPEDISIISFDDLEMSPFTNPPLSTVRVHKEELGRISVKLLTQRLNKEISLPLIIYLPTELILRKSCEY